MRPGPPGDEPPARAPRGLVRPHVPALAAGVLAAACAAAQPVALRLQLRPVAAAPQPAALAGQVAQAAGVPADSVAAAAPGWYTVTLRCPDAARCEQAAARLAARTDLFSELRPDARRTLPDPPSPETRR